MRKKTLAGQKYSVLEAYKKERAEERSCRMTGRIEHMSNFGGKKMHAFWASSYADDKLGDRITGANPHSSLHHRC